MLGDKVIKTIQLEKTEASNTQVFNITLVDRQGLFVINSEFGRKGFSLLLDPITVHGTVRDDAERLLNQVLRTKLIDGYKRLSAETEVEVVQTGQYWPLSRETVLTLETLTGLDDWSVQYYYPGTIVSAYIDEASVTMFDEGGRTIECPADIAEYLAKFPLYTQLEGTLNGGKLLLRDITRYNNLDARPQSYSKRYGLLRKLFEAAVMEGRHEDDESDINLNRLGESVFRVRQWKGLFEKAEAIKEAQALGAPGVLFVDRTAPFRNDGIHKDVFLHLFPAQANCVVGRVKDGVASLKLYNDINPDGVTDYFKIGTVVLEHGKPAPVKGDIVTVTYERATPTELIGAVITEIQADMDESDCALSQLRY